MQKEKSLRKVSPRKETSPRRLSLTAGEIKRRLSSARLRSSEKVPEEEIDSELIFTDDREKSLFLAVRQGEDVRVKDLLKESGVNPDMRIKFNPNLSVTDVQRLLKAGIRSIRNQSLLNFAINAGEKNHVIQLLLKYGATIEDEDFMAAAELTVPSCISVTEILTKERESRRRREGLPLQITNDIEQEEEIHVVHAQQEVSASPVKPVSKNDLEELEQLRFEDLCSDPSLFEGNKVAAEEMASPRSGTRVNLKELDELCKGLVPEDAAQPTVQTFTSNLSEAEEEVSQLPLRSSLTLKDDVTFWQAVEVGNNIEHVQELLDQGAPVNALSSSGRTPLYTAVCRRNPELIDLLLNAGADVNVLCSDVQLHQQTVLHQAVSTSNQKFLELFLAHGADVNKVDSIDIGGTWSIPVGRTALHSAVARDQDELVSLLIAYKPDNQWRPSLKPVNIDLLDERHLTALHIAAEEHYLNIAQLLITAGASLLIQDRSGLTPLCHAVDAILDYSSVEPEQQGIATVKLILENLPKKVNGTPQNRVTDEKGVEVLPVDIIKNALTRCRGEKGSVKCAQIAPQCLKELKELLGSYLS